MSRICICVLDGNTVDFETLDAELKDLLDQLDLSVSYGVSYNEPFLARYRNKKVIILNFSGEKTHDICEVLFLADNCVYNGIESAIPFYDRMRSMETILTRILKFCPSFDLFIGDSGMQIEEFEEMPIHIHEFLRISSSLNTATPPDLHLIING